MDMTAPQKGRKASTSRSAIMSIGRMLTCRRIELSPVNTSNVAREASASTSPRSLSGRGGFKPVLIPTGPRSSKPVDRSGHPVRNVLDPSSTTSQAAKVADEREELEPESVVVLEEERDPEKVLEERRRKREEIMAKFKAGQRPAVTATTPGPSNAQLPGTGADSVTSGGLKTAERTGVATGTTTGERFPSPRGSATDSRCHAAAQSIGYKVYIVLDS